MREMRDSGVEWIGKIPENWIKTSLLNMLKTKICDGPHETPELTEDGIPFISVDSLNDSKTVNLDSAKKCISNELYEEYYKKAPLEEGDILFSKAATIGKTAIVDNRKFMVWSPLAIIKVDANKCDNTYLYYVLNCEDLINYVSLLGGYNTQINVGMRTLEKAQIPVPPIDEQKRIAEYLDSKCSKIDVILSKQEAIIEKLKEYKLSVITEAVTKGLNPDVEMKDSGVEWIGEIPNDWDCTTVARIATVVRGASPRPAGDPLLFNGQDVPWITVAEVTNATGKYITDTETFLTFEGAKQSRLVEEGTLLLSNSGATLGVPKITKIAGCINDGSVAFLDLKINKDYLLYIFESRTIELRKQMQGYGQPNLNTTIVKGIEVPIPDAKEQLEIVEWLDIWCEKIDFSIGRRKKIIEKITEYKQSLIYEVVTGKREV